MMPLNIPLPGLPADTLLKGVETGGNLFSKIMNAKYNNSLHPSGDVANALYVEELRNKYGENDPRYLQAKKAHELGLSARESLIGYRDVLNQTAGLRASSPLGKLIAEGKGRGAQDILANNKGSSQYPPNARYKVGEQYYNEQGEPVYEKNPRTPQERTAYEQAIAKGTTDAAIRNKIPYAKNVKITLDSINPDDLVQYSGIPGQTQYLKDMVKAALGNPSENFLAYQRSVSSAKTLAKQLRQFWGDSIQPSATDAINQLTNPSTWSKNPEVAKQQFLQLKGITDQELQTFEKAGTSPIKLNYDPATESFFVTDKQKSNTKASENKNIAKDLDRDLLDTSLPDLLKISPDYTEENIRHTAKEEKISIAALIDKLLAQGGNQ